MLSIVLAFASIAHAGPGTLIVGLEDVSGEPALLAEAARLGGVSHGCFHLARLCLLDWKGSPPIDAIRALPGLRYVEQDRPMELGVQQAAPPPGDVVGTSACPDLWDLQTIRLEEAWAAAGDHGSSAPVVAIEDSGFLLSHVDLSGQVSGQFDYGDVDTVPEVSWASEVPGHGTFIAGVVAGLDDNDAGRVGIIPDGSLNLQKIADSSGALYYSYAINAMMDLADGDLGVGVLSYSLASSGGNSGLKDAVEALGEVPILVVAAAGNCSTAGCSDANNDANPLYPASYDFDHIVAVAGTTAADGLNPYSHYGAESVDLAAPGVDLCSLDVGSNTAVITESGTSYATPLVAGVAALAWGAHPDLSVQELARLLSASVEPVSSLKSKLVAGGRLDAAQALTTPVLRLEKPDTVEVDVQGSLALRIDNVAAAGEVVVLIFVDAAVEVGAPSGFTASQVGAGTSLGLPGVDDATADAWLIRGELPAHSTQTVTVPLTGHGLGTFEAQLRVLAATDGQVALSSPTLGQGEDASGVQAWDVSIVVVGVAAEDTGEPPEDTAVVDTGPTGGEDGGGTDGGGGSDGGGGAGGSADEGGDEGGCGCATGGGGAGGLLLPVLLGLVRRRRR